MPSRRIAASARYFRAICFQGGRKAFAKDLPVSQPKVEIYTKMLCGYCFRAKRLLEAKGVAFTEYDITLGGPEKAEMLERKPDARTVPQIFIGGTAVGGSDDLARLDREGKLDGLLGL
jgi:glutaredoxin 3